MKKLFFFIALLFSTMVNAQLYQVGISESEITDFYNLSNANNHVLSRVDGPTQLEVSFQSNSMSTISVIFDVIEYTRTGKKVSGKGNGFESTITLEGGNITEGSFIYNGNEYGLDVSKSNGLDILYFFPKDKSHYRAIIDRSAGYANLSAFNSLDQANELLAIMAAEADQAIKYTNSRFDYDYNAPIFYGALDWHSSIEGQWVSMYASKQLNDPDYAVESLSRYTASAINGELSYRPDINEEFYGNQWLFLYADYLYNNDKPTFDLLKPVFDVNYQECINGDYGRYLSPNANNAGEYYRFYIDQGYTNTSFGLTGLYVYASLIGDTKTTEHITNLITEESANINWNNVYARDFLDPATAALDLYETAGVFGVGRDKLMSYWNSRSLTIPSNYSYLSAHDRGLYAHRVKGIWKMYELTGDVKFKNAFIQNVNTIYQELKNKHTQSDYHYSIGHWIPNFIAIALKDYLDDVVEPDTEAPSKPANLVVSQANQTSVSIAWEESSDNIAVDKYQIYKNGVLSGTTQNAFYTIEGLTPATSYTLAVKAVDEAGNISTEAAINALTLEAPDTIAPTAPSNLVAKDITETSIGVSWLASVDNKKVKDYLVYLNGQFLSTTFETNYSFTSLKPSTSYEIVVVARDDSNNLSTASILNVTTNDEIIVAPVDNIAPSDINVLNVYNVKETTALLLWSSSADNVGVVSYDIYRNGVKIGNTKNVFLELSGLDDGVAYTYGVKALDAAGNESGLKTVSFETLSSVLPIPDPISIIVPYGIQETSMLLIWPSSKNEKLARYDVYQDGKLIGSSTKKTYFFVEGLDDNTEYTFGVTVVDEMGQKSTITTTTVTTLLGDNIAPTETTKISDYNTTSTSTMLVWSPSLDNIKVEGYNVYMNGVLLDNTSNGTFYIVNGLRSATSYVFGIQAYDKAGNMSNVVSYEMITK